MDQRTERITSAEATLEKYRAVLFGHDDEWWELHDEHRSKLVDPLESHLSREVSWGTLTGYAILSGESDAYTFRATNYVYYPKQNWWIVREIARLALDEYESLPVGIIDELTRIGAWRWEHFVHMAIGGDKEVMVAYTPNREAAYKDVQLRTTFGRYLRGNFSWLPDEKIQDLDAQLRAHVKAELTLVDDRKEMFAIYQRCQPACMSKDDVAEVWNIENDVHPLDCYDPSLGWRVATVYDDNKVPRARSMVWVNPDDATDKRFGRTYGDSVLRTLLLRDGFKDAPFDGAKLAVVLDQNDEIVLPYVDAHMNNRGGTNRYFKLTNPIELVSDREFMNLPDRFRLEWRSADGRTCRGMPAMVRWRCAACDELINPLTRPHRVRRLDASNSNVCPTCMDDLQQVCYAHTRWGYQIALRQDCVSVPDVTDPVHASDSILRAYDHALLSAEVYGGSAQSRVVPMSETTMDDHYRCVLRGLDEGPPAPTVPAAPQATHDDLIDALPAADPWRPWPMPGERAAAISNAAITVHVENIALATRARLLFNPQEIHNTIVQPPRAVDEFTEVDNQA